MVSFKSCPVRTKNKRNLWISYMNSVKHCHKQEFVVGTKQMFFLRKNWMCFVGGSERTPCSDLFSSPCFLEYQLETRLSFPVFSASFPGDGAPALPACMGVGKKEFLLGWLFLGLCC